MHDKDLIRTRVWDRIDADPGVRRGPGARGRIPSFVGAEDAASRLAELAQWRAARVLKMNPDTPQLALRARAIDDGKLVYMAVPKLQSELPFMALEQSRLTVSAAYAATIDGAAQNGVATALEDMAAIDLIVCGSVAVSPSGARIGKGGGYADIEYALLTELGLVTDRTVIATTVHDYQVIVDAALPETAHDFRVDLIATPTRVYHCARTTRPAGIVWEDLDAAKIAAIPALRERATRR